MIFHRHKWVEKERFYAEPNPRSFHIKGTDTTFAERLLLGVTTIRYECTVCSEIKTKEVLGKSLAI